MCAISFAIQISSYLLISSILQCKIHCVSQLSGFFYDDQKESISERKNSLRHLQCSNPLRLPLEFQCQVLVSWFDTQDSFNVVSYDSQIQLLISSVPNTMALWILEWTWRVITES